MLKKGLGHFDAPCYYLSLVTFRLLRFTSLHHHLLLLLSVLAVITLLKTVYQSLLLLVGFYTLSLHDALPICTVSTTCYFSLVTFHLATPSLVTATFSACSYYLAKNRLSEPSSPRWVRHSYLSKGLRLIPYTCGSYGPARHV